MNGRLCFLGPDHKTKNKKRRSVVPKESYMNINTGSTTVTKKKKRHQLLHTGNSTADSDIKKNSCHVLIPEYLFFLCTSQVRAANAGSGQQQLVASPTSTPNLFDVFRTPPNNTHEVPCTGRAVGLSFIVWGACETQNKTLVLRVCPTWVQ